jgi:hypothetical protein
MSKNINKACPITDEIVSYMYGEIGGAAELEFETHLAGCMVCTDEFAEASNARFSVYEWKRDVFDPLSTPHVVVPYGENAVQPNYIAGLIAAVRAWTEGLGVPLAVAAGLALCIGAGVIVFSYFANAERQVATNVAVPAVVVPDAAVPPTEKRVIDEPSTAPVPVTISTTRPERAVRRVQKNVDRPVKSYAIDRNPAPQARKAPVLTAYQETDDNSLRLADLFDEVGG